MCIGMQAKQPSQKFIWIITHGVSGVAITEDTVEEYNAQASDGKIYLDECYTTKDQAHHYTLIHVSTKIRDSNVQSFMNFMTEKYHIVQQSILGYSPVDSCTDTSSDGTRSINPIFGFMLKHKMENNPNFREFKMEEYPRSGGLLNPHKLCKIDKSFKSLISSISSTGKRPANDYPEKRRREDDSTLILGEASGAASTSAEERLKTQLAEQERELRGAVEREKELRTEIEQLTAKNDELTAKNDELTAELTTKNEELITANEELEQLRVNHAAPPPLAVDQGEIERLREENESLKTKVEKKNEKIKELKHNKKSPSNLVETLNSQNVELIAAAAAKDTEIVKLTAATAAKNNKIAQITAATAAKDTTIADLRRKLAEAPAVGNGKEKDDEIEDLIKQNIEYQEITKESLDREQKRINERPVRNNEVQRLELKIVEHQIKFMSYLCGDKRAKEDIARTQLRVIVTDIHNRQEECYRGMRELCAAAGHRFPHF